jgi:hypothetical protein
MDFSINGIYDAQTLKTLQALNVNRIGFDLRSKSLNIVPFHVLKTLIPYFKLHKNELIFQNDQPSTISSFLDLLGDDKSRFILQFRDQLEPSFYQSLGHAFSWFFHPDSEWEVILNLPNLRTVYLPLEHRNCYQHLNGLWQIIQARQLEVIIHLNSILDSEHFILEKNLNLSADLGKDIEIGFRQIDQKRISNLKIWRSPNENIAV